MRERDFAVEVFGEGLQINIGGINVIVNVVKGFARDVAVRHHNGFQSALVGDGANIDDVFGPDGRLVIGESDRRAPVVDCKLYDLLGFEMRRMDLVAARFRDVPILAEETAHIASSGAHRKDSRARKKMVQRLFLDGINLNCSGRSIAEAVKFSALIDADEAEASLSVSDVAMPRAEIAMQLAVGVDVPPAGFVQRLGFLEHVQVLHFCLSEKRSQSFGENFALERSMRGGNKI